MDQKPITKRTTQMGTGKPQQLRESLIPEPEEREVPRRSKPLMPDLRSNSRSSKTSTSIRRRKSRRTGSNSQLSRGSRGQSWNDPNSLEFKLRILARAANDAAAEAASLAARLAGEGAETEGAQEGDLARRFSSVAGELAVEPDADGAPRRSLADAGRSVVGAVGGGGGESATGLLEADGEAAPASPGEAAARYFRERLLLDLLRRAPPTPPPTPSAAAAAETLRSVLKDVLSKRASAAAPKESVLLTEPAAGPELPDEWRLAATRMPLAFQEQLRNEQNVGLREGPGASDAAGLPLWPGRASGAGAWARRRDARPHTVGGRLRCGGHVAAGRKPRHGLRERARVVGGGGGGGGARGAHLDQRPATQPARLAPPPPGAPGAAARAGVRCSRATRACECVRRARARRVPAGAGDRPRPPWVGPCAPPPPSPRQRQETLRRQTARASAAAIARRTAAAAAAAAAQGAANDKRHRGGAAPSAAAAASAAAPGVASVAAAPDNKAPHHKKELGAKDNGAAGNNARDSVA